MLPVEKRLDGKIAFERFDGAAVRASLLLGNERKVVFDGKIIVCGGFVLRGGRKGKPASVSPSHTHSLFCLPFLYIF